MQCTVSKEIWLSNLETMIVLADLVYSKFFLRMRLFADLFSQGLKHLHDNQLYHINVKPANIFIGCDGFTCKLGDFGLTISMDTS